MSKFADILYEFLEFIDTLVKWFCVIVAGAMAIVVMLQVFSRYLPTPTPPWTEELARYLMIYVAFIGASHGIREWNNINVDFFINRLPKKASIVLDIIIKLAVLALIIFLGYLSIVVFPVVGRRQLSATLNIPMLYPQLAIPIGCLLMALQLIGVLLKPILKGEKAE